MASTLFVFHPQLVLGNGLVAWLVLCGHSGDLARLMLDKSLVGRLGPEPLSDGQDIHIFLSLSVSYCINIRSLSCEAND